MPETAFNATVLEGRERRYTIINEKDFEKYVPEGAKESFRIAFNNVATWIEDGRIQDGKKPFNSYIVINTDERYINDIIRVMHQNDNWDGKLEKFQIEDIDGCEFVKSIVIGNMIISHHQDFDGYYTGKIQIVYPDGSHGLTDQEEAQKKFDSGEWTVIR